MKKKIYVETKFNIVGIDEYERIFNMRGFYSKANNAAKQFYQYLTKEDKNSFQELVNYQGNAKDIYNNKISKPIPFQSLRNINTLLCLLFSEHSGLDYNIEDVKNFLKSLKVQKDDKNSDAISSFNQFIKIIKPHLTEELKNYEYKLNPRTWEFEVHGLVEVPDELNDSDKENSNKNDEKNNIIDHQEENNIVLFKWKYLFILFGIIGLGYYTFLKINNNKENRFEKIEFTENETIKYECILPKDRLNRFKDSVNLLIVPYQKDSLSINLDNDYEESIYNEIHRISVRDSLKIRTKICDAFKDVLSPNYGSKHDSLNKEMRTNNFRIFRVNILYQNDHLLRKDTTSLFYKSSFYNAPTPRNSNLYATRKISNDELKILSYWYIAKTLYFGTYLKGGMDELTRRKIVRYLDWVILKFGNMNDNIEPLSLKAELLKDGLQLEQAIAIYDTILRYEPENQGALLNQGDVKMSIGDSSAIANFKKLVSIDSKNHWARYRLAICEEKFNNNYKTSLNHFIFLIDSLKIKNHRDYFVGKQKMELKLGLHKEAFRTIDQLISIDMDDRHGWFVKGEAHMKLNQTDLAIKNYELAISSKHPYLPAHKHLSRIYYEKGNIKKAISELSNLYSTTYNTKELAFALGLLHIENGNFSEAIKIANLEIKLRSNEVSYFYDLRRLAYRKLNNREDQIKASIDSLNIIDNIDSDYFKNNKGDFLPHFFNDYQLKHRQRND